MHKKKKKKDKKTKTEQKPAGAVYKMEVYKEFGNSLSPGYEPRPVYARIVKIVAGGEPVVEPTLTSMIEITGDDYLRVRNPQMSGAWKAAYVEAPEQAQLPEEGVVTFTLAGDAAGYVNHLHFHIEAGEVLFGQQNLTLPSGYKKEVRLPFVVVGRDGQKDIKARIVPVSGSNPKPDGTYDVKVEWSGGSPRPQTLIRRCRQVRVVPPGGGGPQ